MGTVSHVFRVFLAAEPEDFLPSGGMDSIGVPFPARKHLQHFFHFHTVAAQGPEGVELYLAVFIQDQQPPVHGLGVFPQDPVHLFRGNLRKRKSNGVRRLLGQQVVFPCPLFKKIVPHQARQRGGSHDKKKAYHDKKSQQDFPPDAGSECPLSPGP